MSAPDVAAVRVDGPYAGRLRWYRAVHHAVVGAGLSAGALFEAADDGDPPTVVLRPASLAGSLVGAPAAGSVRLRRVPVPPAPEPPGPGAGRFGAIVPDPGPPPPDGPAAAPAVPAETPALGPLRAAGAGFAVQAFWVNAGSSGLKVGLRFRVGAADPAVRDRAFDAVAARLVADWRRATGVAARIGTLRLGAARDWRRGRARTLPAGAWGTAPEPWPATAELGLAEFARPGRSPPGHTIVFGASGAGKTTWLAARAAQAIADGRPAVVVDLHGDLAPRLLRRLPAAAQARLVAVDASAPPVPGIAGLVAGSASADRAAAHFVAAVKRLSPDGTEIAWGFRLERIFDSFARLVLDQGGSLVDLYALLTDGERREAARLGPLRPAVARFLDELGPILRRDPEFLWSAATRLSKVVLVPGLLELLAPSDGGLDAEGLLADGRAVAIRLPIAALGPEAATFAATLVLGRIYLGLAARPRAPDDPPVLFVLDEVQGLAPRLVAELLAEGRKFGVEALVATQYPDRLAPEVRSAAAGAASAFVAMRVPPATAGTVGPWIGLPTAVAAATLPALPVGVGLATDPEREGPVALPTEPPGPSDPGPTWADRLRATRLEFGVGDAGADAAAVEEGPVDRLLLAVLGAAEEGRPLAPAEAVAAAASLPGGPVAPELLERAWERLARSPAIERVGGRLRLSAAGERQLGLTRPTGATRETSEHRALLLRTFRVFARRGYRIEILRQGRFDTTLPDALFRQLPAPARATPAELAALLDRIRGGWAWRYFRGRDVHVEAEVSGAMRADRIGRGWAKARGRGACVLFVVGDGGRAARIRRVLRARNIGPDDARVWVLRPSSGPPDAPPAA